MSGITDKKEKFSVTHKIGTIVGTVLCIILIPILVINLTFIIKSYVNKDRISSVGGFLPLIVLTDSMYPTIHSGDLAICRTVKAEDIQVGDVIAYFDPAGNEDNIVTHRVIEITTEDGQLAFRTQGDANNTADELTVSANSLVGIYHMRIAGAGNVAMFLQSSTGLIVCVVIPLLLLVGYDIIRRRIYEKHKKQDTEAMLRELEDLRAQNAEKNIQSGDRKELKNM